MKHVTFEKLENILGKTRAKENFNLSPYLTLRTNTTAEYYFEAESREDLIKAKKTALELNIPFFIIGGGSNLAIIKNKLAGLIIRNKYIYKKIVVNSPTFVKTTADRRDQYFLTVSSGYPITRLAKELADLGYAGLEYQFGLPGTIGGALFMNSKWTKPVAYVGDNLISANILDNQGNEKKVDRDYFQFAYDTSILQKTKETVLEAVFKLKKVNPNITKEHTKLATDYRKLTQPHGVFTSGCFFRNVNGESAGKLVDRAGLKNKRVGQFHVSDKHANFIINDGNGKPEDLKHLLLIIKNKVKDKFNIDLVEEVIVIG